MKGAEAIIKTMIDSDVRVCFGNPGTSEMHFVAALDRYPEMRGVLCLFEGLATGAADGYGRMTRRPAATLLHLGPGLGNGLANLHNARCAGTAVLNVVGAHSSDHKPLVSPLDADIDAVAGSVSAWLYLQPTLGALPAGADPHALHVTRVRPGGCARRPPAVRRRARRRTRVGARWGTGDQAVPPCLGAQRRDEQDRQGTGGRGGSVGFPTR